VCFGGDLSLGLLLGIFLLLALFRILGKFFGDLLGFGNSFLLILGSDEFGDNSIPITSARGILSNSFGQKGKLVLGPATRDSDLLGFFFLLLDLKLYLFVFGHEVTVHKILESLGTIYFLSIQEIHNWSDSINCAATRLNRLDVEPIVVSSGHLFFAQLS
jgi:hypothetical protein